MGRYWDEPPAEPEWDGEVTRDLTPRPPKRERPFKIQMRYHKHPDHNYFRGRIGNYWYGGQAYKDRKTALKRMAEIKTANTNPPIYSVKPYSPAEDEIERFGVFLNGHIDIEYRLIGPKGVE